MAVRAEGQVIVDAGRTTAFDFVADPARLAGCIPGCRDVREIGFNRYEALLTASVAFITLNFTVIVEVVRIERPGAIEVRMSGDSVGLAGRVAASGLVQFADAGENKTSISYATDIALTGRLGGLGEPAFRSVTAKLAQQFGRNLKEAIEHDRSETRA